MDWSCKILAGVLEGTLLEKLETMIFKSRAFTGVGELMLESDGRIWKAQRKSRIFEFRFPLLFSSRQLSLCGVEYCHHTVTNNPCDA
jgi:hypothetical protein